MNYGNKKVLVTGATGLIGKELIKPLLASGFDIHAISTKTRNDEKNISWYTGNLFDKNFIKETMSKVKPAYLLNMAWAATDDYLTSDINYDFLNCGIHLIQEFKNNGGKRAIYAGSCFEYEFKQAAIKENDKLNPEKYPYTFCKNKLREIVDFYSKKNDISFGYGRIFYVYGRNEYEKRLTAYVINSLRNNEKAIIKSGPLEKDYMYTKDIAGAFVKFLESDINGVVNISTGKPISIKDFTTIIAKKMKKENLLVFQNECSNQPPVILGDNTKLTNEVGYKIQYTIDEAFNEILGDYNE